jgi:hypothetical protein
MWELVVCAAASDQFTWAAARRQPPAVISPIGEVKAEWRHAVRELMTYAGTPYTRWWRAMLLLVSSHGQRQQQRQQQSWAAAAAAAAAGRRPAAITSPIKELSAEWRHALRELETHADMPCGNWWRALLLPISSHG